MHAVKVPYLSALASEGYDQGNIFQNVGDGYPDMVIEDHFSVSNSRRKLMLPPASVRPVLADIPLPLMLCWRL